MPRTVGVVSIQGDFDKHLIALSKLAGTSGKEVRVPEDLSGVDALIIPGGESTTVGKLMQRFGLGDAIREHAGLGMPIWGTCMGMILLAKRIEDRKQYGLDLLNVTVQRNAFGAQVHSFEDEIQFDEFVSPFTAVFIRAPVVTEYGENVCVLSELKGKVIAVRQQTLFGTSFHPELTDDLRIHEWWMQQCCK